MALYSFRNDEIQAYATVSVARCPSVRMSLLTISNFKFDSLNIATSPPIAGLHILTQYIFDDFFGNCSLSHRNNLAELGFKIGHIQVKILHELDQICCVFEKKIAETLME